MEKMWKSRVMKVSHRESAPDNNAGSYQDGGCPEINPLGPTKMAVVQERECGKIFPFDA